MQLYSEDNFELNSIELIAQNSQENTCARASFKERLRWLILYCYEQRAVNIFNPLLANVPISYLMKTLGNRTFSGDFRKY